MSQMVSILFRNILIAHATAALLGHTTVAVEEVAIVCSNSRTRNGHLRRTLIRPRLYIVRGCTGESSDIMTVLYMQIS